MENQTHSFSDILPVDSPHFDGEFEIDGNFLIRCTGASAVGDLQQADFMMRSDFGEAQYTMLGKNHYFLSWGTYCFHRGLSYAARGNQPVVELHFQLQGFAHVDQHALGTDLSLQPGDSNLIYLPSLDGSFSLNRDIRGSVFEILLSPGYFAGLAERYPHLFAPYYERMLRQEPFLLSDAPLRITPEMWGVIHRIRQRNADYAAGSLFLEAQILQLLALQFGQLERPVAPAGSVLSETDRDRMYEARDVLLSRLADPPSLAELARCVGTNEFKLKYGFKALFGTSPYAYLLEHKLELARAYILDTDLTIAEIAHRVGYRDPAHLTNAFRKQFDIRPSDLR